jgi:hypothetical protein
MCRDSATANGNGHGGVGGDRTIVMIAGAAAIGQRSIVIQQARSSQPGHARERLQAYLRRARDALRRRCRPLSPLQRPPAAPCGSRPTSTPSRSSSRSSAAWPPRSRAWQVLRNSLSDAHGRGRNAARPAPRHAELAVNAAFAVAGFDFAVPERASLTCQASAGSSGQARGRDLTAAVTPEGSGHPGLNVLRSGCPMS